MRTPHSSARFQTDLLPNQFRLDQQLQTIRYIWLTVIGLFVAFLLGTTVAESVQHRRETQRRDQLVAQAFPLVLLRQQTREQTALHALGLARVQAVESAKPGDDLLQVLAAIAFESPSDRSIAIESLQLQLPLEYKQKPEADGFAEPPTWATGKLVVSARSSSSTVARQWAKQIQQIDRIDKEHFREDVPFQVLKEEVDQSADKVGTHQPVTITARPLSEVRLP